MTVRGLDIMRWLIASVLCVCSTPVLADQLILRCDSRKDALSFSVLIDLDKAIVLDMGFSSKVTTERFSETIIAASDKEPDFMQSLIIDRVTGQFELTLVAPGGNKKGENYLGSCVLGKRLF